MKNLFVPVSTAIFRFLPVSGGGIRTGDRAIANFGFRIGQDVGQRARRVGFGQFFEVAPKGWTEVVPFKATVMKHLKSRKHHSKEYRRQAVELLLTGRTLRDLATELDVGVSTLQEWKEKYLQELAAEPADVAGLSPLKMQEELKRLRKENQKLKLHQEILKKAMGILSDLPPGGMP